MDDITHKAFLNAIKKETFTTKTAHDFMYMYSTDGFDYFKNIDTREYIKVSNLVRS